MFAKMIPMDLSRRARGDRQTHTQTETHTHTHTMAHTPQVLDGEAQKIEEEKLRAIGQRNRAGPGIFRLRAFVCVCVCVSLCVHVVYGMHACNALQCNAM